MLSATGGDGRLHLKAATSPDLLGTTKKKNGSRVLGKRNKKALQSVRLFNYVSRSLGKKQKLSDRVYIRALLNVLYTITSGSWNLGIWDTSFQLQLWDAFLEGNLTGQQNILWNQNSRNVWCVLTANKVHIVSFSKSLKFPSGMENKTA